MELVQLITHAFHLSPYPGDENISAPTYDDEGTAEYFKGKKWQDLSAQDLRHRSSSLTFFTNSAFCYYVPAYMLAVIEDATTADVIIDHLWNDFSPPKNDITRPSFQRKWECFSGPQKQAIVEFMEYMHSKSMSPINDRTAIDVLRKSLGKPVAQ
ncbi:DUF6714 family protein [Chitinibacteraceae bacterium HSL-7]